MKRVLLVENNTVFREALAFVLNSEPDLWVVGQAGLLVETRDRVVGGASAEGRDRAANVTDAAIIDLGLPDIAVIGLSLPDEDEVVDLIGELARPILASDCWC